jgi:hypothetical protein
LVDVARLISRSLSFEDTAGRSEHAPCPVVMIAPKAKK